MKKLGFMLLVTALALMAVPFAAAAHPATSAARLSPGTSQLAQAGTTPDAGGAGGAGAVDTPAGAGTGTGSGAGGTGAGGTGAGGTGSTGAGSGAGAASGTAAGNTAGSNDFNWLWLIIPLIILIGLGAYLMSRGRQTTIVENRVEHVDRVDTNRP
jgi:hypothetical protein